MRHYNLARSYIYVFTIIMIIINQCYTGCPRENAPVAFSHTTSKEYFWPIQKPDISFLHTQKNFRDEWFAQNINVSGKKSELIPGFGHNSKFQQQQKFFKYHYKRLPRPIAILLQQSIDIWYPFLHPRIIVLMQKVFGGPWNLH